VKPETHLRLLKTIITVGAVSGFATHLIFPNLKIDAVSFGFLLLALLPWLSPLIKSAKLPGGFEIEFQDVKNAADKVAAGEPAAAAIGPAAVQEPSYLTIAEQDPRLGLILLRIEIEKRLRAIADKVGLPKARSISQMLRELEGQGVLSSESLGGLRDLISLGNQAAHGVPVSSDAALSAVDYGPRVLGILDTKLAQL
jgi:hypothetical protein